MDGDGRPTFENYQAWALNELGVDLGPKAQNHYETASQLIHQQTLQSNFWQALISMLPSANAAYVQQSGGYPLFASEQAEPRLHRKEWRSIILKSYRKNISSNISFPEAPVGGWVVPPLWFETIGDVIRSMFVVKYLDGVDHLAQRVAAVAGESGLESRIDRIGRFDGYYAVHVDVVGTVDIPGYSWDSMALAVPVEIQVTTQLQDNIRQLLHRTYERTRVDTPTTQRESMWQWQWESRDFRSNYLGHVLHYLEGMVMSLRSDRDD